MFGDTKFLGDPLTKLSFLDNLSPEIFFASGVPPNDNLLFYCELLNEAYFSGIFSEKDAFSAATYAANNCLRSSQRRPSLDLIAAMTSTNGTYFDF